MTDQSTMDCLRMGEDILCAGFAPTCGSVSQIATSKNQPFYQPEFPFSHLVKTI